MLVCAVTIANAQERVTLNFVNADLDAVVRAIGHHTGRTFVVDPSQKPKSMDFTLEKDKTKRTTGAIYELQGDTLKICYFEGGKGRPKEFVSDEKTVLGVLKREKK